MTSVRDQPTAAASTRTPRTRLYRNGSLAQEGFPVAQVSDFLSEQDTTVWLDLRDPTRSDLATVAEELGLHALAVEDALQRHQRTKLDRYDGHLFLTVYSVHLDRASGELHTAELAVFATDRALITVHDGGFDVDTLVHRWDSGDLTVEGTGALLHGILDLAADTHLDAARELDEELDALEAALFEDRPDIPLRRVVSLRRAISELRRIAVPMREIVSGLLNHDLDRQLLPYFQDVQDHVLHAIGWTDSLRELTNALRDGNLNAQSNQLNQVMKKVTGWAAIIAVPTAITGFYGQNIPYPGNEQPWGFWISTVAICVLSIALYASFKRRDWL